MSPREILKKAFAALAPDQRDNLRAHARAKTRIFCGSDAVHWSNHDPSTGRLVKG